MRNHIDLPTLDALQAEWRMHPPVHHLVAAYLGYKAAEHEPAQQVTDIEEFASETGSTSIKNAPAIDTTAFDLETRQTKG